MKRLQGRGGVFSFTIFPGLFSGKYVMTMESDETLLDIPGRGCYVETIQWKEKNVLHPIRCQRKSVQRWTASCRTPGVSRPFCVQLIRHICGHHFFRALVFFHFLHVCGKGLERFAIKALLL